MCRIVSFIVFPFYLILSNPVLAVSEADISKDQSIKFFNQQAERSSVSKAIRTLVNRYPSNTGKFVDIALTSYPTKYRQIITASISAQPMYVDEVIRIAVLRKVSTPLEIVRLAINAEPSYAEYTTAAACLYSPDEFLEIVKMAVATEPDSADQIVSRLATQYPNKAVEIMVSTITEVPFVGKYIVDALLALFPNDNAESRSLILDSVEKLAKHPQALNRLVELANIRGIDRKDIANSAIQGGLSTQDASIIITRYYK